MPKSTQRLPLSVEHFVAEQTTLPVADIMPRDRKDEVSPYGCYWYRAIACMLLSGRVHPKSDGDPSMTDVNRLGKEANFNQYIFERVAKSLVAMGAIKAGRAHEYTEGENLDPFWEQCDTKKLTAATWAAVLDLVGTGTSEPGAAGVPRPFRILHLIEFLQLFLACFNGPCAARRREGRPGVARLQPVTWRRSEGCRARVSGIMLGVAKLDQWIGWSTIRGKAALAAVTCGTWNGAYLAEHEQTRWIFASPTGLGMLGLETPLPAPDLAQTFQVLPDLSVFAGAGRPYGELVPLFRHGVVRRIDHVFEFRLDRRRLSQAPTTESPGKELRQALHELEPLPPTVSALLATGSRLGGEVGIRWCSALVHPESSDVLEAIRSHPKLKGYIEPGAPPGYLLIKGQSDPANFVERCRALGFQVKPL